jgi:hypothetical protein
VEKSRNKMSRLWTLRTVVLCSAAGAIPVAALVAGCSSSSSPATSTDGGGGGGGGEADVSAEGAADAGADGKTVWIGLKVASQAAVGSGLPDGSAAGVPSGGSDAGDAGGPTPIEGVKVCAYQNPSIPCVMTDSNGHFQLGGLPPRTNVPVSLEKAGYLSELLAVGTPSTGTDNSGFPTFLSPVVPMYPNIPGATVDSQNKGAIAVFAVAPARDAAAGQGFAGDQGATITISPDSGIGPYFADRNNLFVTGATTYADFLSAYFNLDPGTYTVTVTDPINDCEAIAFPYASDGYPVPNGMHEIQLPVAAGFTTLGGVLCTTYQAPVSTDGSAD